MKTTELNMIANTQAKEEAAKVAAEKAKQEQAVLEEVKPGNLQDMLDDLNNGLITIVTDENDNIVGLGCHPHVTGVKVAKMIKCTLTVGATEEERAQDELDYKKFLKKYGSKAQKYLYAALTLQKAGLNPDKIIETCSNFYYVLADQKKVIDANGHTKVDLSTKEGLDGLSKELLIEILVDKLNVILG